MKCLNFTAVEVLPSLLDKTKTQTIRPAWKNYYQEKPARFKVGDKVKLYWTGSYTEWQKIKGFGLHSRVLGTVEIIEVFKIIFGQTTRYGWYVNDTKYGVWARNNIEELAKRDGFSSAEEMFSWFDKMYDLSSPKEFWVYRWKWVA